MLGHPALVMRAFFRRQRGGLWTDEDVAAHFDISLPNAKTLRRRMVRDGFAALDDSGRPGYWNVSEKGLALASARASKPVTRATAERALAQLMERVVEVNTSDRYVYRVSKLVVFGSYLSNRPDLGDVDVAYELKPRFSGEEFERRCNASSRRALRAGRQFKGFLDQLFWPNQEVVLFLKSRSRVLSLHSLEQDAQAVFSGPHKVLVGDDRPPDGTPPVARSQRHGPDARAS